MRSLEARLGNAMHGTTRPRGNTALDILTGRQPDYRFQPERRVVAPATQSTLIHLRDRSASVDAATRFRIARPVRRRRSRFRALRRYSLALVLLAGGLVAFRARQHELTVVVDTTESQATALPTLGLAAAPVPEEAIATPEPTPHPAAAEPVAVPANEFQVVVDKRFATSVKPWPGAPQATVWSGDGAYRLRASQPTHFVATSIPGTDQLGDAILTASFHKADGPAGGGYGLIVRDQGPGPRDGQNQLGRFYVFEAGDQGKFGVWLRDEDHWVDLLTWTPTDAIHPGTASNELTVTAIGDRMSFLINGIPVATQLDTLLHTGGLGIFNGGDGNEVAVEHIAVRVPR
jgi:hypothetical protein